MSKAAAIHIAVLTQMAIDNKGVAGLRDPICLAPNQAATNNQYDDASIRAFAANVAFRLRGDTPPFDFKWSQTKLQNWRGSPLWLVEADIASATSELEPAKSTGPSAEK
jgi:hypothetical protein